MDDIHYETVDISRKKLQSFEEVYMREKEKMIKELVSILKGQSNKETI